MKITQFEQSGFVGRTESRLKPPGAIGHYTPLENLGAVAPDAMLVSHIHPDHFSLEQIKALAPKKLYLNRECIEILNNTPTFSRMLECVEEVKVGDEIEVGGIKVKYFDVDHGPN